MISYLISDNTDTLVGMRLAGITGEVVRDRSEALKEFNKCISDKNIAILIVTEKIFNLLEDELMEIKLKSKFPLIVEIPTRDGLQRNDDFITKYINESIEKIDTDVEIKERIEFAKQNDWSERAKTIMKYSEKLFEKVSIIIVTYNNLNLTKKCINSILERTADPNYEIIIVDNASSDETSKYLEELEKKYKNIKIKLNKENLGFASGNNQGIKMAEGEYCILLNNDTIVTRGWITGLIKHFEDKKVGMVGSVTNSIGNEAEIEVDYVDETGIDEFSLNYTTEHYNETYEDIKTLAMYCVALKKEIVDEIGLLDENYERGMFEDDDYSIALKKAGYKIVCAEDVFIHHFWRASFKKINDKEYKRIFEKNKKYYEQKWNTIWTPHRKRIK